MNASQYMISLISFPPQPKVLISGKAADSGVYGTWLEMSGWGAEAMITCSKLSLLSQQGMFAERQSLRRHQPRLYVLRVKFWSSGNYVWLDWHDVICDSKWQSPVWPSEVVNTQYVVYGSCCLHCYTTANVDKKVMFSSPSLILWLSPESYSYRQPNETHHFRE